MPETNAEALRAEFARFDSDGSGSIDEDEFARLLSALGVNFDEGRVHTAFLAIDVNGNRRIDFGEFAAWWARQGSASR